MLVFRCPLLFLGMWRSHNSLENVSFSDLARPRSITEAKDILLITSCKMVFLIFVFTMILYSISPVINKKLHFLLANIT